MASTSATEPTDDLGSGPADDRGSSSVELVIIFPVTLLLVLIIVQFGIWYHATDIARAAAQQGVKAASGYDGGAGSARSSATQVLDDNARGLLQAPSVTPTADGGTATVVVRGRALSIVPGMHLTVRATATAPVERFRVPGP